MSTQNNKNETFDEDKVLFEDDVEELRKKLIDLSEAGKIKQKNISELLEKMHRKSNEETFKRL